MKDRILDIAATMSCSVANGPGKRFVIWLQGCTFKCPGCINPEFQKLGTGKKMKISFLIKEIKESIKENGISGVTLSGGEPLLQAESLKELILEIKKLNLSVFLFTGFTPHELDEPKKEVWDLSDIVVSGRYISELATDGENWIASSNQELFINNALEEKNIPSKNICEIRVCKDGSLIITGIIDDFSFFKKL